MDKQTELTVNNILESNKATSMKDAHFIFKCDKFEVDIPAKFHRLDDDKILSNKYEEMYQSVDGVRCVLKKVGFVNGTPTYFPAMKDEKGKWVADTSKPSIEKDKVSKVILDVASGLVAKKDTNRGLWFVKLVPNETMNNWKDDETYNFISTDYSDRMLEIYDYLTETRQVAVFKFNPYGTAYNGFLYPQRIINITPEGVREEFRLLMKCARGRIDKPEIAPTMLISNAQIKAKERERIGVLSAIEEV